ncbi:MAG: LysM peptidoglycan-binding domain-containing protein [Rhodanobacter sp.]
MSGGSRSDDVDTREAQGAQAGIVAPATRADSLDVPSHETAVIDETTIYLVLQRDTLATIAARFYGNAHAWKLIFDANRDQLSDPEQIEPGQMLKIPTKP